MIEGVKNPYEANNIVMTEEQRNVLRTKGNPKNPEIITKGQADAIKESFKTNPDEKIRDSFKPLNIKLTEKDLDFPKTSKKK